MSGVVVAPPIGLDGEMLDEAYENNGVCYSFTIMTIPKQKIVIIN